MNTDPDVKAPLAPSPEVAFRRAMMIVNPAYFSWDPVTQENYRLGLTEQERARIERELLHLLFGVRVKNKEEAEAAFDDFDDACYLLFNSAMLHFHGFGDDDFYLNESLPDGKTLADFPTLRDYDLDDFRFQQQVRQQTDPAFVPRPYLGSLGGTWARLRIDGVFFYASLWMASSYVAQVVDEAGTDKIDALIPHRYVEGEHHGKRDGKGFRWDMRVDADGQEASLDELRERYYRYLRELELSLAEAFDRTAEGRVCIFEENWDDDPHMSFVFSDESALRDVRFRHFMADCRRIARDRNDLDRCIEQERQRVCDFLEQTLLDIREHFDPSVIKLRKKRKIIVAEGAMKDLL